MHFVYVLKNPRGQLYVGQTNDLARRLEEHNSGLSRWTRGRGPWVLVFREDYPTRAEAMRREKELKTGRARQDLGRMLSVSAERVLPGKD